MIDLRKDGYVLSLLQMHVVMHFCCYHFVFRMYQSGIEDII